jgi:quercetin dioxygenase-like cupin family protein
MQKHVLHEDECKCAQLDGRSYKHIVGSERLPCAGVNGGVSFFGPRAHAPSHVHQREEEVVYCVQGEGEIVLDGQPEAIRPGSFVVIPRGVLHSINNTGDREIKLVFLFSPPCDIGNYPNVPSH